MELLKLVQLDWLANRYPSQLSGGQRQRVALARALAVQPKVLLLDEPFGALDAKVRKELRQWLRRLHEEIHVTSVFVTHDQEEALEVADRVVIMNSGRVEQVGTPNEVFHRPASEFVMRFLGEANVFHGRLEKGKAIVGAMALDCSEASDRGADGKEARIFVRPHDLDLELHANGKPHFPAEVRHVNAAGPRVRVELQDERGSRVDVELPHERYRELSLERGMRVYVTPKEIRAFTEDYVI
jgi:sulfate transport system ATP-binding protein